MGGPCPYQSSKYLPLLRDFAGAATGITAYNFIPNPSRETSKVERWQEMHWSEQISRCVYKYESIRRGTTDRKTEFNLHSCVKITLFWPTCDTKVNAYLWSVCVPEEELLIMSFIFFPYFLIQTGNSPGGGINRAPAAAHLHIQIVPVSITMTDLLSRSLSLSLSVSFSNTHMHHRLFKMFKDK